MSLEGAYIEGVLDLNHLVVNGPIRFSRCVFEDSIQARHASVGLLALESSHILGVDDDGYSFNGYALRTGEDAWFDECEFAGSLDLALAQVDGQLSLTRTSVTASGRTYALDAYQLYVVGDLLCEGMRAKGTVRFAEARIGGRVVLTGAQVGDSPGYGASLDAKRFQVAGDTHLDHGFTSSGTVVLSDARVGGRLFLASADLAGLGDYCLNAKRIEVQGDVYLDQGLKASGTLLLAEARIDGALSISSSSVDGSAMGRSVDASRVRIGGDAYLDDGFSARGTVSLAEGRLGGALSLRDASLRVDDNILDLRNPCLDATKLQAEGDVVMDGIDATGMLRFSSADLGGDLSLRRGHIDSAATPAIEAESLRVRGEVTLGKDLVCENGVRLSGVSASRLVLAGRLGLDGGRAAVDLTDLKVDELAVSRSSSELPILLSAIGWQLRNVRGSIRRNRVAARNWLDEQHAFGPQPWHELAAVYERNGQLQNARRLRYWAAIRVTQRAPIWSKPGRWLYRAVTGYGLYPLMALAWLLLLFGLTYAVTARYSGDFTTATTQTIANDPITRSRIAPSADRMPGRVPAAWCYSGWDTPCFSSIRYTFTTALPATAVGARDAWEPPAAIATWLQLFRSLAWILTALLVAGVAGLLRPDHAGEPQRAS